MNEKLDLAELERLCAAATPAPWESRPVSGHGTKNEARYVCRKGDAAPWWVANVLGGEYGPFSRNEGNANSDLIVALRNAAPLMLSRLRALERVAAAAKEYRLRERTGGGCDIETTARLNAKIEAAREKLDESLKEAGL